MMRKRQRVVVLWFSVFLCVILAAAGYVHRQERDKETQDYLEDHSYFDNILFCGARLSYLKEQAGGAQEIAVAQEIRLVKRREGKWSAYIPADLAERAYIQFDRFSALRLEVDKRTVPLSTFKSGDILSFRDLTAAASGTDDGQSVTLRASILDGGQQVLEEAEIVFFLAEDVPTLYLATQSGSMEAVNEDKSHREEGRYVFYTENGKKDVTGRCRIHGRGNSSWKEDKKQYSLNLAAPREVLGMETSTKFALIANHSDASNLRNKVTFDLARLCGMPSAPRSVFVNVYFNGVYNGLYLLAQRPNARGGSVRIADLEEANRLAAEAASGAPEKPEAEGPGKTAGEAADTPDDGIVVQKDENGLELHAAARDALPENITGGYLLEMDGRYEEEDYWFSTVRHHFVIKYPEEIPLGEAAYIADHVRRAEAAFYSADGIDPDTGRSWEEYLDRDSWVKMYVLQDFLAQWDIESFSFFVYKDADDPLLYCGPVWDFDLAMGTTGIGNLPDIMRHSRWLTDHREGWLTQLASQPAFSEEIKSFAGARFFPVLEEYLGSGDSVEAGPAAGGAFSVPALRAQMEALTTSAAMDCHRWKETDTYIRSARNLLSWLEGRRDFWKGYLEDPGAYCKVTFRYGFSDMDIYVRRGEAIGFVPTEEYGEHLYSSFRKKYGEIAGWTDEEGNELTPETVISGDRVFVPHAPPES